VGPAVYLPYGSLTDDLGLQLLTMAAHLALGLLVPLLLALGLDAAEVGTTGANLPSSDVLAGNKHRFILTNSTLAGIRCSTAAGEWCKAFHEQKVGLEGLWGGWLAMKDLQKSLLSGNTDEGFRLTAPAACDMEASSKRLQDLPIHIMGHLQPSGQLQRRHRLL
jgi:hypothetical protein